MTVHTVGIHSPGDMGQAVGAVLRHHGLRVVAALEGRSQRTRALAGQAGIDDVGTLAALVREADLVLSILVPAQAEAAARAVAEAMRNADARPLYADCNAVSAETAVRVGAAIESAGAAYVDASIIGPPPRRPGVTRFYAAGAHAAELAALRDHGLDVRVLDGPVGSASALKTAYASLTKGLQALGTELLVYAHRQGIAEPLADELRLSQPRLFDWLARQTPITPPKAHRFVGEMEEHGRGFAAAGMPAQMMEGAAAVYRLLARTPLGRESPEERPERTLEDVIAVLAETLPRA